VQYYFLVRKLLKGTTKRSLLFFKLSGINK
jgi:hypothetical protein